MKIDRLLFETNGVVNFNAQKYIEVQPGVMTPLVINVKNTFSDFKVRQKIAKELASLVNPDSHCICGIESGGSYYGAAVADLIKKPLILYRKQGKKYGLENTFVGATPTMKKGLITIVDDVIGEGKISSRCAKELMDLGYDVEVVSVFTYLPSMKDFMKDVRMVSLTDINSLCKIGRETGRFTKKDVELIKTECKYSSR